uniref:RNA helicase n=1 Tax=Sinocyclocheilus anshuiensis TaxID=1608454 RepID=A0A671PWP3_9TELE
MATFESLGLSEWLMQQCKRMGISRPTPVQEKCIPAILEGKDLYLLYIITVKLIKCFQFQKKHCRILTMMLRQFSFPTISLHSMMKQVSDISSLTGLDIPTVQVVINHNSPGLPKIYIHRVGRTARAGRNGVAITLVTQYDIHLINAIEEQIQAKLKEFAVEEKEVLKILTQVNVTRRQCEIRLESTDFDEKKKINKRKQMILEGKDPDLEEKRRNEQEKIRRRKKKQNKKEPKKHEAKTTAVYS